jgi:hypothetical protein
LGGSSLASAMGHNSPVCLLMAPGADLARASARDCVLGACVAGHVRAGGPRRHNEAGGVAAQPQYTNLVGRSQPQHPAAVQS